MNRRSFLGNILLLGAAPAIVRADSLMRVIPHDTKLLGIQNDLLFYNGIQWSERELAYMRLAQWHMDKMDGLVFNLLHKDST